MEKKELVFINNVKNYEWWVFSNDIICPVAMYELRRPVFCRNSDESSCEAKNFSPKIRFFKCPKEYYINYQECKSEILLEGSES